METLRKIALALVIRELREKLRGAKEHNREIFEAVGISAEQFRLLFLGCIKEACDLLIAEQE